MATEQYHEPAGELPEETRTFARVITSLIEEGEAINWYGQRLALEKNKDARAVMNHAMEEEFIHFGIDLEFLLRSNKTWKTVLQTILFHDGDLVKLAQQAEEQALGG